MAFNMTAMRMSLPTIGVQRRPMQAPVCRPAAIPMCMPTFSGLGVANRLLSSSQELANNIVSLTSNGCRVFAMRHGKRVPKLNRPADQRKALIRGLVTEVLRHGRIKTTKTRAKAIRKYVDKMIGLAKDGSLHARRQALAFVYDGSIVKALFDEAPKRYETRTSGYCRVITEPRARRGDAAEMAAIELV